MIDYYIVCTNQPDDVINNVGIRYDLEETIATHKVLRSKIVSDIMNGKVIYTAFKSGSILKKGSLVMVFAINGLRFIKTERNESRRDNLDNLRECNF